MTFFLKAVHLLTLGLWLGGVTFFSFFSALPIIHKYESLAERSDNWLGLKDKRQGTRAAGEALDAVFARYFWYQVACGVIAFLTSLAWWSAPGMAGKARVVVIAIGLVLALVNLLVLAPQVSARVAVEQASTFGWERFVGCGGAIIGMRTFGASAPLKELQKLYGFTVDNVLAAARQQLEKAR